MIPIIVGVVDEGMLYDDARLARIPSMSDDPVVIRTIAQRSILFDTAPSKGQAKLT